MINSSRWRDEQHRKYGTVHGEESYTPSPLTMIRCPSSTIAS